MTTPRIIPTRMNTSVHIKLSHECSQQHYSQKVGTTPMSTNRRMNTQMGSIHELEHDAALERKELVIHAKCG